MHYKLAAVLVLLLFCNVSMFAQSRLTTKNSIGWYNLFATIGVSPKVSLHTEYQWRRNHTIETWQQSLLRVGVNYKMNNRVLFRLGYGLIETFPYGEIPINAFGKKFTEHRIFEMMQLNHKEGMFDLSHRFMLEQRFVGRYSTAALTHEDSYPLLNRARYMFRLQIPFTKNPGAKFPYAAAYDEILIAFGKNVSNNVFDQNRIGVLLGMKMNDNARVEAGYINQTLQFARRINDQNVFQVNSGVIVNAILNLNLK